LCMLLTYKKLTLTLPYRIKVKCTHYKFFEFGRMCQKPVSEFVGAAIVPIFDSHKMPNDTIVVLF
jgi:hypothetical protein